MFAEGNELSVSGVFNGTAAGQGILHSARFIPNFNNIRLSIQNVDFPSADGL